MVLDVCLLDAFT
ncbi:hypothetical protein FG135_17770 [Vibrio cholerae]|uniref:Uncharacterized protein n=1 Tax=Vibrio cholerae TaxID=666 RepID=A0A8B5ZNC0_VIBCL|nr:hypothetical protein [Vibrio cholerae]MBN7280197.1 hypothetical protein [Vibrio paracholerae]EGR0558345.1 hypothetical protein [Vibrio cholerae]EGR0659714.1 hypothetical protein [Vibrio cholerae]EGR1091360.1 hypothetical protein [Vibrio cholerae]